MNDADFKNGPSKGQLHICDVCEKTYTRIDNLNRHKKTSHPSSSSSSSSSSSFKSCSLCNNSFIGSYSKHLTNNHHLSIETEKYEFEDLTKFRTFLASIEMKEKSNYSIRTSSTNKYGQKTLVFNCSRNGSIPKKKTNRLRAIKSNITIKTGNVCPSRFYVRERENSVSVTWTKTHIGHDFEINYLRLPQNYRDMVASYLRLGIYIRYYITKNLCKLL